MLESGLTQGTATGSIRWDHPLGPSPGTIRKATGLLTVAIPAVPEYLAPIDRIQTVHKLQHRRQPVGKVEHPARGPFCLRRKPHE
jgi:hypothetical protein